MSPMKIAAMSPMKMTLRIEGLDGLRDLVERFERSAAAIEQPDAGVLRERIARALEVLRDPEYNAFDANRAVMRILTERR